MSVFKSLYNLVRKLLRLLSKLKQYVNIQVSKAKQCIAMILFCECLFYMRHKYLERIVNRIPFDIYVPAYNKKKIQTLQQYAFQYSRYFDDSHRKWLGKAFNCSFKEIKKGNMRHLIQWGYFLQYDYKNKSTLSAQEIEWREDIISNHIKHFEEMTQCTFEDGYNASIQTVYCTHPKQKIPILFHPLTMYLAIALTKQWANCVFMFYLGFKYKSIKGLKVWYRLNHVNHIQNATDREPILMLGGISGANPMQNIIWMSSLIQKYKRTKNLFVIEIPWSEMSIAHFIPYCGYLNHKIPPKTEELVGIMLELERMILMHNGNIIKPSRFQLQWNLTGQSYGTFICSGMYQNIKECALGVIPRLILMDAPALCISDLKNNRLWGPVETDLDKRIFQLLIGQEIMIATTGARYFPWFEYCLFPHQLVNDGCHKPHIIVSGTRDHVIPFNTIRKGVEEANKVCQNENKIIHMIIENGRHGQILGHRKYQAQLIELL
eukprot:303005_1